MFSRALHWVVSRQSRYKSLTKSEFCSCSILFFLFLLTSFGYKWLSCRAEAVNVEFLSVSWHMKIQGSIVFQVQREVSKANSRISTVDFRKEDFWLFQGSPWQDPMRECPEGKGAQESWLVFKDNSSKHKSSPFQHAERGASMAEDQHRRTKSFWLS